MNLWQNYLRPTSLFEALRALRDAPAPAAAIAGGTDLLVDLAQDRQPHVTTLIDLSAVCEMTVLEERGDSLYVGAAVPLSHVAANPLVLKHAPALVEACDLIGGPQVRNVATLGGNVAHALPAADGTIALLALGAVAEIATIDGQRMIPMHQLFEGPGRSSLRRGVELIAGFHLPLSLEGEASAFKRIMRPQGVALPILNLAVWIQRVGDEIGDVRIAVGPAGPTPRRAVEAEIALRGKAFSEAAVRNAGESTIAHATFRTSQRRATADYRRILAESLFRETVSTAWERTWK
jgi:CO/xanthine dehydrogenase FAD-binding subunit